MSIHEYAWECSSHVPPLWSGCLRCWFQYRPQLSEFAAVSFGERRKRREPHLCAALRVLERLSAVSLRLPDSSWIP